MTHVNIILNKKKISVVAGSISVSVKTETAGRLFDKESSTNKVYLFVNWMGLQLSYGSKELKLSLKVSLKKILLILFLLSF